MIYKMYYNRKEGISLKKFNIDINVSEKDKHIAEIHLDMIALMVKEFSSCPDSASVVIQFGRITGYVMAICNMSFIDKVSAEKICEAACIVSNDMIKALDRREKAHEQD